MPEQPLFADVLLSAVRAFDYAGFDTPQLDARLLLSHAAGISHAELISQLKDPVSESIQTRFSEFVSRRLKFEPVHRILGMREFYGREFKLGTGSLVPRPDTETLIDVVLEGVDDRARSLRILDLGTGSGIIAVTLACELKNSEVVAVDISEEALANCRDNADLLGVGTRVQTLFSDLFSHVEGQFDLVVSNPPYIPTSDLMGLSPEVRLHDPDRALDGGFDGLDFYRQIFSKVRNFMVKNGRIALEFGFDQPDAIHALAEQHQFQKIKIHQDLAGHSRVLEARID